MRLRGCKESHVAHLPAVIEVDAGGSWSSPFLDRTEIKTIWDMLRVRGLGEVAWDQD